MQNPVKVSVSVNTTIYSISIGCLATPHHEDKSLLSAKKYAVFMWCWTHRKNKFLSWKMHVNAC